MILRLVALLAVLLVTPAFAEEGGPPPSILGVLRADGTAALPADLGSVDQALALAVGAGRAIQIPPVAGAWIPLGAVLQPCKSAPTTLAASVAEARGLMSQLQEEEAIEILRAAIATAPCGPPGLDRSTVTTALDLLGQAAQDGQKEGIARDAYTRLLALDPAWKLQTPPGTGYETLWNAVRREVLARPLASFALWHQGEVRIDGEAIAAGSTATLELGAGSHWVQWTEGGAAKGQWFSLAPGTPVGLIASAASPSLLQAGPTGAGTKALLTLWLGAVAQEQGLDGIAVVAGTGDGGRNGWVVRGGTLEAWAESVETQARGVVADRVRIGVGGGYLRLASYNYGSVHGSAEFRIVGPLHLVVEGDLGFSEGVRLNNPDADITPDGDGEVRTLPALGAGALIRLQKGPIQPFVGVTAGATFDPPALREGLVDQIAALDPDGLSTEDEAAIAELRARPAAVFRVLLDGGVDLIPGGGRLVIRPHAGVGWNGGLLVRGGLLVGIRLGMEKAATARADR